ncbi:cation-translocating P-type ATPase [Protofrankia symbiont of Coriaria ruscifolia]|uniref:cation-translocating P-type ATPase n=1 Tax=Protofrankia symbiont of Coriaria ruscifolia TaxID=1306542 RepID=UPI0010419649|nr:HAD-IC family P-type ATPase [Protofrankia symbiont of Coriaria ruscifolia]
MHLPSPLSGARRVLAEGRLLGDMGLVSMAGPLLERMEPTTAGDDRLARPCASLRVRGASGLSTASRRRLLEQELQRQPGVLWARVNAPLGRVLVGLGEPYPRASELTAVAERVVQQADGGAGDDQAAADAGPRPRVADLPDSAAPVLRAAVALAADGIAFTVASVGRIARWTPFPVELASLVTVVDTQPRLRGVVEKAIGPQRADVVLAVANATAMGLAGSHTGLGVDAVYRAHALAAARARRDAFAAVGDELMGDPDRAGAGPVAVERPRPRPSGPVERYADVAGAGVLATFGATAALTGDPRRAVASALAMLPRPARLGREGFCNHLTRVLARRGAQVMHPEALRLLDRVDTVVVDSDVLFGAALTVGEVIPLAGADASEVAVRAYALFRSADPAATVEGDGWTLAPIERLVGDDGPGSAQWRRLRAAGIRTVLGLAQGTRLTAVVTAVPERAEGSEALLASCRRSGLTVRVADGEDCPDDGFGFGVIPGGRRLVAAVGDLQAAGAGVLVVSRRRAAVGNADCGVGVEGHDGALSWGADVLVGKDLLAAAMMVEAVAAGCRVSRHAVRLAQIGSGAGALVALTGFGPQRASRSMLMVTGASALSFGDGIWAARELDRRPPPPSIPRTPWHVLPARRVLDQLGSSPDGLASVEAASRRTDDVSVGAVAPGLVGAIARELASPLTPILLGGAALSAASGSVLDAGLVVSVAVMSALVGAVQQRRADRDLARLFAQSAVRARVRRDGGDVELTAQELVSGDVISIGSGDVVPADARLLSATSLEIDESSLTGESLPVTKSPRPVAASYVAERSSMVYEGTTVVAGSATAVVVATGLATEAGRSMAAAVGPAKAVGVEARLTAITEFTVPVALGAAATLLASGLIRGLPARNTLSAGVALAVAAVPEGLPFLATAAQLSAARRLSGRGALVRNPRTIETLGRVDVLCFDKTGTLTRGKIRLGAVSDGAHTAAVGDLQERQRRVVAAGLRATPVHTRGRKLPHPTDRAMTKGAAAAGIRRDHGLDSWSDVASLPFEPGRAYHASLGRAGGTVLLSVKGAPETVLPRCARWRTARGSVPLDSRSRASLAREHLALGGRGYRVLAVADRSMPVRSEQLSDGDLDGLTFLGFLGMSDPVRAGAGPSLVQLHDAGVQTVMITGDHPATAQTIAAELGVIDGGRVVTGMEIDALDDDALDALLPEVSVVARGTPAHKVRVVESYKRLGKVVAMTGDGANDAPAIRLADVGIALGKRGTPSARAAADVVVTDDRLETILDVLVEGRSMWASVRQALGIFVGGNLGEIAFTLLGAVVTGTSPLSARQLLLVNLLTDLAPGLAVALRQPDPDKTGELLGEGPESSLGRALVRREVVVRAVATTAAAAGAWIVARPSGRRRHADTVGLVALVAAQLGQTLLVGGRSRSVLLSSLGSVAVLTAVVQTPGLSQFFGCTPLGPFGWAVAAVASIAGTLLSVMLEPLAARFIPPDSDPRTRASGSIDAQEAAGSLDVPE